MFFSNTGSTDLRDTDVQQPKTTETLSFSSSSRAFSAKSGQSEAGSTTTASSLRPSSPPFLFCSSISIRMVSFSVVSLMAIVPESECSTPTLMGPCALRVRRAIGAADPTATQGDGQTEMLQLHRQLLRRRNADSYTKTVACGTGPARLHLDLQADAEPA